LPRSPATDAGVGRSRGLCRRCRPPPPAPQPPSPSQRPPQPLPSGTAAPPQIQPPTTLRNAVLASAAVSWHHPRSPCRRQWRPPQQPPPMPPPSTRPAAPALVFSSRSPPGLPSAPAAALLAVAAPFPSATGRRQTHPHLPLSAAASGGSAALEALAAVGQCPARPSGDWSPPRPSPPLRPATGRSLPCRHLLRLPPPGATALARAVPAAICVRHYLRYRCYFPHPSRPCHTRRSVSECRQSAPRPNLPLAQPPSLPSVATPTVSADLECRPSGYPRHGAVPRPLASPSPLPNPSKGWACEFKQSLLIVREC